MGPAIALRLNWRLRLLVSIVGAMKPFCLQAYAAAIAKITNTTNEKPE